MLGGVAIRNSAIIANGAFDLFVQSRCVYPRKPSREENGRDRCGVHDLVKSHISLILNDEVGEVAEALWKKRRDGTSLPRRPQVDIEEDVSTHELEGLTQVGSRRTRALLRERGCITEWIEDRQRNRGGGDGESAQHGRVVRGHCGRVADAVYRIHRVKAHIEILIEHI